MKKSISIMSLSIPQYEKVLYFTDPSVGLEGYIAIHSTSRGPALGGTRFWPYASKDDALQDVLRLAEGMSLKAAGADLPLGGGKAVLIGDPKQLKCPAFFHAYGEVIESLQGQYITAEDMNITTEDIQLISEKTSYVVGRSGLAGNPSPWTALGVFHGLVATLKAALPNAPIPSLTFAIQGVGETGFHLLKNLIEHGAKHITIADINPDKRQRVQQDYPFVNIVDDHTLLSLKVDVLCPCAFGGILSNHTLPIIQAKVIAGSANNIFLDPAKDPHAFHDQGIFVAPDYLINAGGLMCVHHELIHQLNVDTLTAQLRLIGTRLKTLYKRAKEANLNPFSYSLQFVQSLL
jgi:leucine dehydrogenase